MRRMPTRKEIKDISTELINLKNSTDLDTITTPGMYKVNNYEINGVNYDGTLVILPWDSNYFRQVFYTLDNKDPNPIFTRIRVNTSSRWKEWEIMDNSRQEFPINIKIGTIIKPVYAKAIKQNNKLQLVFEGKIKPSSTKAVVVQIKNIDENTQKKIIRFDGTNISQPPLEGKEFLITRIPFNQGEYADDTYGGVGSASVYSRDIGVIEILFYVPTINEYYVSFRGTLIL